VFNDFDDQQLRSYLDEINNRDKDRVSGLLDHIIRHYKSITEPIAEYRLKLKLGSNLVSFRDMSPNPELDLHFEGAQQFVNVMELHPALKGDRDLVVGISAFEEEPPYLELGLDACELIAAGITALGFLNITDERYVNVLMHVALNADAISSLLRYVILGKPIPDIDIIFKIPEKLENLYRRTCGLGVQHALHDFGLAASSNVSTTFATGIAGLQPNSACARDTISIVGNGFGGLQPIGCEVWFPKKGGGCVQAAGVSSWQDTQIDVIVPDDASDGCIGFVQHPSNPIPMAESASTLAGEMEMCFGKAAYSAAQHLRKIGSINFVVSCPSCLPNNANYFQSGPPEIDWFTVNGRSIVTLEPIPDSNSPTGFRTPFTLSWKIRRSSSVLIRWISGNGPSLNLVNPAAQPINLAFTNNRVTEATYELSASNGCGTVTRTVTVRLQATPQLSIVGIEVVQSIQRPNNSVRLVAGKRTIVRVFVDSGISNGFDNGGGRNSQPNITGSVVVFPIGSTQGFDIGTPLSQLNPTGTVTGRPPSSSTDPLSINRNVADHSLNFEIPLNLVSNIIRVEAKVVVRGHENDLGGPWRASGNTTVIFLIQPRQEVLPMLIADTVLGGTPTDPEYRVSLQGARTRFPISESGFIVNPSLPMTTGADLTVVGGWERLVLQLATMIFFFPTSPVGGIRTAIVPNNFTYALNGIAMPRFAVTIPAFVARATLPATFAHEMDHTLGVNHAPCGSPPPPIDPRLPGRIEDTGMDVAGRSVIPSGRGELMSLCDGQGRWPSIANWDIVFGSLPI